MATTTPKTATKSTAARPTPVADQGFDVRKALTDAGYIAVGLGVLSIQQLQTRRHQIAEQLSNASDDLRAAAKERAERLAKLGEKFPTIDLKPRVDEARARLQNARERANEIGENTRGRVSPVVEQFEHRVGELPAPLPRAAAPVVKAAKQLIAV